MVVPTATSLCEVVVDIISGFEQAESEKVFKDEKNNTTLLAGIIFNTNSFRDPKTTSSALQKAALLISGGAKRQEIIQYLFKTKSLQQLQLWGRALARLTEYPDKQILTAVLTKSDLEKTHSNLSSLPEVCKDIIEMVTGYSLLVLIAEGLQTIVVGLPHENISEFAKQILGTEIKVKSSPLVGQYEYITFETSKPLPELQEQLNRIIQSR
jgi:nanoRNase/pAp phosphatase (c-di-AMP/oligoRNAs hydrolase)